MYSLVVYLWVVVETNWFTPVRRAADGPDTCIENDPVEYEVYVVITNTYVL